MAYMSKLDVLIKGENGAPDITEEYDLAALRLVDAATRDPLDIGDEATPVYFANGVPRECVIGEGGGGSVVSITPNYTGGNLVARYTIDGKSGSLYSPKVGSAYTRTQLWEGNGAGLSNVGDNNDSAPFSSSLGNYSFLLIHYAPSNNINEERVMMVDAKVISDLIGSQNAYISCHYLSDVFIKCKFNTQTTIEVVESRSLPLPNDQTLKCVIKKIEGITFGVSGEDLAQGLNVIKALWSGTADTVGDTRNFVRDAIIDDYNFIYVHYYEESNPYDEKILILDEMAIRNGLAPVGSEDPSQSYFTCYITDNLYIKGLFTTASQFTIVEVSDDDNKHCIINRIDGVSLGASNAGGGSSSDCMKKGVDYVTAGAVEGSTIGPNATVEGSNNNAISDSSHAEGYYTYAGGNGMGQHAEGGSTIAYGEASHAEGYFTTAYGNYSHSEGFMTYSNGGHVEGMYTSTGIGECCHAEGGSTIAVSGSSHAEGYYTCADGDGAHVEGLGQYGSYSVAFGGGTHSEGYSCSAIGGISAHFGIHAEGYVSYACGDGSHAEGYWTTAYGDSSHSEGYGTYACGSKSNPQHVQGKYNLINSANTKAFIIGNGNGEYSRSNLFTIDWDSNINANALTQGSSRKIKENIKNMSQEEAKKILQLRPVSFDYIKGEGDKNCYGLIAEEVQDIGLNYPVFEGTMKSKDEECLQLDYSKFVPYLIKMIQIQEERINNLEKELEKKGGEISG